MKEPHEIDLFDLQALSILVQEEIEDFRARQSEYRRNGHISELMDYFKSDYTDLIKEALKKRGTIK